jgi:hypothetical protein
VFPIDDDADCERVEESAELVERQRGLEGFLDLSAPPGHPDQLGSDTVARAGRRRAQ